jgi:hypothetical protein
MNTPEPRTQVAVEAEHDGMAAIAADLFEVAGLADLVLRLERACVDRR